jgi:hypothetical protein
MKINNLNVGIITKHNLVRRLGKCLEYKKWLPEGYYTFLTPQFFWSSYDVMSNSKEAYK